MAGSESRKIRGARGYQFAGVLSAFQRNGNNFAVLYLISSGD